MALLFIGGVLLIIAAATLLTRAVAIPRLRVATQVRQIGAYGFQGSEPAAIAETASPALRERVGTLAEAIGSRIDGQGLLAQIELRLLRGAGVYEVSPAKFQGYRALLAVGMASLVLLEGALGKPSVLTFAMILCCLAIGWMLPPAVIRSRAERRMDEVDRHLPELIDLLIATVEAGLGFAGSLQLVASRFDGPLGQELRLTLQEQSMGLPTERALENFVERCDTPSVRAFVRAIVQGESLGVSIGTMLRNLAGEVRKRRRQSVREQMMKVPVKMMFPLVFLILPALFMVLLFPAGSNVFQALGMH